MNFNKAEFAASYGNFSQIPPQQRLEIAFAGRSNVGKSSLINKILNRKSLARVSSVPGKTATINFFSVDGIYFVDLPGYGYAKVSKTEKKRWSELIDGYLMSERNIALVLQLIDMRHPPTEDDLLMIDFLIQNQMPFIVVLTKADKLSSSARRERLENFKKEIPYSEQIKMIEFSSVTGEGVYELRRIIEEVSNED
ncbi:MAG: ribosome biosis GTP-binding protein YsxC/EngB [Oscillospiraceae bacterium]|jgi:GTP-binding protein|nr:ribosome biosis GTP-binding protein YsxC/EngB [Oscillospiraceae bacterium]